MKIGIITCHDVFNYGSSLQAYALSHQLKEMGAEVKLIDYKPDYQFRLIDFMEVDSPRWQTALWRRWLYRFRLVPTRISLFPKYFRYRRFNRQYLPLTEKRYHTESALHGLQGYDGFICGSDQIWASVKNKCGEDGAFFLSFAEKEKKIAYAASFGAAEISPAGEQCVRRYLPAFDAIGVREASGVALLRNLGISAQQVIDPVFLPERELWEHMVRPLKKLPEKYILAYGYDSSTDLNAVAGTMSDLPVISLGSKAYSGYGPETFLYMVRNASLVVTSSFHAVAFSLLFETPFVAVKTGNVQLFERLNSILQLTGLEEQLWEPGKQVPLTVDFAPVRERLSEARMNALAFLKESLYGS